MTDKELLDEALNELLKNALTKTYSIRKTGKKGATLETTIPKEVVERKARKMGLSFDEAVGRLRGKWHYNNFHGLFFTIEDVKEENK